MKKRGFLIVTILALLGLCVVSAGAQEFSRKGKGEIYGVYQMMSGDSTAGTVSGLPVTIDIDDSTAYGIGVGTNIHDNFNLNTDLLFGSFDTDGTVDGEPVSGDTDIMLWNFNIDYNIFKDRLTPFVSGGIGTATVSTDLDSDEAFLISFDDSNFSYNFSAGVRWDATDNLFIKAMYRWTWINLDVTSDTISFDGLSVFFGARF